MNIKSLLLTLMAIVCISMASYAQPKGKQSYNYTRAIEEAEKGNASEAMDFLDKEINDNPNNGYAHFHIAILYARDGTYDEAMKAVTLALKKLPKKDKEYTSYAYSARAHLYAKAGDTISAIGDLHQAININPESENSYEYLGDMLYSQKRYDEADEAYRKIMALNPMNEMGYMGLGRDACAKGDYEEAIRQYNAVLKIYDNYSSAYSFRAEAYLKLGKYTEAINDITKALSIDNDDKAQYHLFELPAEQINLVVAKLKGLAIRNPHNSEWWYYIGQLYIEKRRYSEAIEALQKAFDIDAYIHFIELISQCYRKLGEYDQAIEYIDQAIQMEPDNLNMISTKADILGEAGNIEGAIAEWTKYIESNPDYFGGYYRRGFFKDLSMDTDAALEDYNMAIMLYPGYAYSYLGKGDMLMRKGLTDEAMEAYQKVVELDTEPNNNSCAMYALLALGEKDEAIDFLNRKIENNPNYAGSYYDAACLYSRMGDLDKSLANLRLAFEKGFRRFHHVRADDDLIQLRHTAEFEALMEEYEGKTKTTVVTIVPDLPEESKRVEIPFTPEGGCLSVKCSVNDLPLSFLFDTGASVVSLSQVEANFMLKNGYLKRDDIVGTGRFVDANGDISEGTVVNLRNVDFGGLKLNNVRASIVRNQKAPLLLGQSVLGRLGSIEIDNPGKKLIITR